MSRKVKILIFVVIFFCVYVVFQILPHPSNGGTNAFVVKPGEDPLVIAHGGSKLLYPENTRYAFSESYKMGVDALEVDLVMSKDGLLITHHDLTIDRMSEGEGSVNQYTYEQLLTFNFGYDFVSLDNEYPYRDASAEVVKDLVPITIEELFQTYGKDVLYVLELKDEGELGIQGAQQLHDYIVAYDLEEYVCVATFHEEVLTYFQDIRTDDIVMSMDLDSATQFIVSNLIGYGYFMSFENEGIQIPMERMGIDLTNPYILYKIRQNHLFVHYWTINEKEDMQRLVEQGVDGIITDRPDLLFEVLEGNEK